MLVCSVAVFRDFRVKFRYLDKYVTRRVGYFLHIAPRIATVKVAYNVRRADRIGKPDGVVRPCKGGRGGRADFIYTVDFCFFNVHSLITSFECGKPRFNFLKFGVNFAAARISDGFFRLRRRCGINCD